MAPGSNMTCGCSGSVSTPPEHRERLDGGARLHWRLTRAFALPLQLHIVHEGGQLYDTGPVRDSVAVASGIVLSKTTHPRSIPRRRQLAIG